MKSDLRTNPEYDPNGFLDWLSGELEAKNDAALARKLAVMPPVISKIRHLRLPVGDSVLVRVSDLTGLGTAKIKAHMFRKVRA